MASALFRRKNETEERGLRTREGDRVSTTPRRGPRPVSFQKPNARAHERRDRGVKRAAPAGTFPAGAARAGAGLFYYRKLEPASRTGLGSAHGRPRGRGGAFGLCPDCSPLTEWFTYSPSPRCAHRSPRTAPRLPRAMTRQAMTRPRASTRHAPELRLGSRRATTRQATTRPRAHRHATPPIVRFGSPRATTRLRAHRRATPTSCACATRASTRRALSCARSRLPGCARAF